MSNEKEIVVICKIGDFNGLKEADFVENHDQLELYLEGRGRMRTRKTVSQDGTDYEACIKGLSDPNSAIKNVPEIPEKIGPAFFEGFRMIADALQIKKRHVFRGNRSIFKTANEAITLPPIDYEVDVFTRPDGRESEWCKIDIELNTFMEALASANPNVSAEQIEFTINVTDLPFKPQMAFVMGDCTDQQKAAVAELWEKEWTQTPYGKPRTVAQSSVSSLQNPQQPTTQNDNGAGNESQNNETT